MKNVILETGQKITIAGKEYTVIEQVEGSKYKVLAIDTFQHRFDASSIEYANSEIATYLDNDYYNTLPENIKNAIVEIAIQQKVLSTGYDSGKNRPTEYWTGEVRDTGIHKVFLPSWDEATKVYGTDKLKAYAPNGWTWLRDIYNYLVLYFVLYMDDCGNLSNGHPSINLYVRPAMVLDLSKVKYAALLA